MLPRSPNPMPRSKSTKTPEPKLTNVDAASVLDFCKAVSERIETLVQGFSVDGVVVLYSDQKGNVGWVSDRTKRAELVGMLECAKARLNALAFLDEEARAR